MKKEIYLRPLKIDDTEYIVKWRNSPEILSRLFNQEQLTAEMHLRFYEDNIKTGKYIQFIIEEIDESNLCSYPIGTSFFKNIDLYNQKCELGIFTKGLEAWTSEFGLHPTQLMLKKAFDEMQMNKVYVYVFTDNHEELAVYDSCGFSREGELKQEIRIGDKFKNVYYMGLLKEEYRAQNGLL